MLTRENKNAHMTVSAWITDQDRKMVLMAYHNIYDSWAWLGGHADGNADLKEVIVKEIREESGLKDARSVSYTHLDVYKRQSECRAIIPGSQTT